MNFHLAVNVVPKDVCVERRGDKYKCRYCDFLLLEKEIKDHLLEHATSVQWECSHLPFINIGLAYNCPQCNHPETHLKFYADETRCTQCGEFLEAVMDKEWYLNLLDNDATYDIDSYMNKLSNITCDISVCECGTCDSKESRTCCYFRPACCDYGLSKESDKHVFTCLYCSKEFRACLDCIETHLDSHYQMDTLIESRVSTFKLIQALFDKKATVDPETRLVNTLAVPAPDIPNIIDAIWRDGDSELRFACAIHNFV